MPKILLPFPTEKEHTSQSGLYHRLPQDLQEQANNCSYLLEYLQMIPTDGVGVPQYYPELSRKLMRMRMPHLIYPVREKEGEERIFIHIYPDPEDIRNFYIPVEPIIGMDLDELMAEIEVKLLDSWAKFPSTGSEEQKRQDLLRCIDEICHAGERRGGWFKGSKNNIIRVTPRQLAGIKYLILRDKTEMGVLEPLLRDPYIEDISCSGLGQIYIEHKIFGSLKTAIHFTEESDLDEFVLRLSDRVKAPVTARRPVVDSVLPDGSRINIVYGSTISKRGSNFTIRKFSETPLSILELIELGTLDYTMIAYLSLLVEEGANVFIVGETASGKTTLLNALTTFILPDAKVISIEDTPELQVPHKNWLREVTKISSPGTSGAEVSMFHLLKASLRQRPDIIIIGEIRGEEGAIAFQAMQTGHAVMSTFHADSVARLIQRLTGTPINIPKTFIDNLNLVVILARIRLPDGNMGRRVLSINEIVGYDGFSDSFSFIEVFSWDALNDKFEFVGYTTSYILEEKIALKRGIPPEQKQRIYDVLKKRVRILERLHKREGVRNFYELLQALAKLQKQEEF